MRPRPTGPSFYPARVTFFSAVFLGLIFSQSRASDPSNLADLGMNVGAMTSYGNEWTFVDVVKMGTGWRPIQPGAPGGLPTENIFHMDQNGWITYLEPGQVARMALLSSIGQFPDGLYNCYFDGEGELSFSGTSLVRVVSRAPGHIVLQINGRTGGNLYMDLTATNPDNHIRNIRVIMPGFENTYQTQPFHPLFLERLRPFKIIRFCTFTEAGVASIHGKWNQRVTKDYYTQSAAAHGMALEYLVQACNTLHKDMWYNIPYNADDDFVRRAAELIRDTLDPSLKVYMEYSNEAWAGPTLPGYLGAYEGVALQLAGDQYTAMLRWDSQRQIELARIWKDVFGASHRYVPLLASQYVNGYANTQILNWQKAYKDVEALTGAPYFGISASTDTLLGMSVDQILDGCARDINDAVPLYLRPAINIAKTHGLKYIAYESGSSLNTTGRFRNPVEDQAMQDKFFQVNTSARMYDLYLQYIHSWHQNGGDLMLHFELLGSRTFGILPYADVTIANAPKYRALLDYQTMRLFITNPINGSNVSQTTPITITGSLSDVNELNLSVDGSVRASTTAAAISLPFTFLWDTTADNDGFHLLKIEAASTSLDHLVTAPVGVTVVNNGKDVTLPTVSISSPTETTVLNGMAPVNVLASDDVAVQRVELYADSVFVASTTVSPYTFAWDTTAVANGTCVLIARAIDTSNNARYSEPVAVDIENSGDAPPVVSISTPTDTSTVAGFVRIVTDATDDTGVAEVDFYVDDQPIRVMRNAPFSIIWDAQNYAGPHRLEAVAIDNSGQQTRSATINVDVENPPYTQLPAMLYFSTPRDGSDVTGQQWINLTVDYTAAISSVQFYVDGQLQTSLTERAFAYLWNTNLWSNGPHQITATVVNTGGFSISTGPITVNVANVDKSLPTLTLVQPLNRATVANFVTLLATATDNVQIASVEFYADGTLVASRSAYPYRSTWDTTLFSNGLHSIFAKAIDVSGNSRTTRAISVDVENVADSSPPIISITTPVEGAVVTTTTAITIVANDDVGIDHIDISVDNVLLISTVTRADSFQWNTALFPDGAHVISAIAYDEQNQIANAVPVSITIANSTMTDTTSPTISISVPYDSALISGSSVTLKASAFDDRQVVKVEFYVDDNLIGVAPDSEDTLLWDSNQVHDGTHAITAKAYDATGNVGVSWPVSVHILNDTTPPTVTLTAPTDGSVVAGNAVPIVAEAFDNVGISRVDFYIDGSSIGAVTSAPYAISWDAGTVSEGPHTFFARAIDFTGNAATSPTLTATVSHDTTIPTVSLVTPSSGTIVHGTDVIVTADASDNTGVAQVDFYLDGHLFASASTPPYSVPWDVTTVDEGPHTLFARATDLTGNVGVSEPVAVIVSHDTTAPSVTLTAPVDGALLGAKTIELDADASDDVAVKQVEFFVDGNSMGVSLSPPYIVNWDAFSAVDGLHSIFARATDTTDNVTNSNPVSITISHDTTPPAVSITAPSNSSVITSDVVDIDVNATDDTGIAQVEFDVDGSSVATSSDFPYTFNWDATSVAKGEHVLQAKAVDVLGNEAVSAAVSIVISHDHIAPSVTLTAPEDGIMITADETDITADASDDDTVAKVDFWIDNQLVASVTSAPYLFRWNTSNATEALHTLSASAIDPTGNVGTSKLVSVIISHDVIPPSIVITAPSDAALITADTIELNATATDNVAVAHVDFYADGDLLASILTAPYSFVWDSSLVPDGLHTIVAKAVDPTGNIGISTPVTLTISHDLTPPLVSITSPSNGTKVTVDHVIINADATDNQAIQRVEFFVDQNSIGSATVEPYSLIWDTTNVPEGIHHISATALDPTGNVGLSSEISVDVVHDTMPPVISVDQPTSGAVVSGAAVPFSADVTDPSGISHVDFSIDGQLIHQFILPPYLFQWDSTQVQDGNHVLKVAASDTIGNTTESVPIVFTVLNAPTPPSPSPPNSATGFRVYPTVISRNNANVTFDQFPEGSTIFVTDELRHVVKQLPTAGNSQITIDLSDLSPGLYFCYTRPASSVQPLVRK